MKGHLPRRILSILEEYGDPVQNMRIAEAGRSAPDKALGVLIDLLNASDEILRRKAADALGAFPEVMAPRAAQIVEHLEHDQDPHVRVSCAIALSSVRSPEVDCAYRRALPDPFERVVEVACRQVAARGGADGIEALQRVLAHASWRVRLEACKGLIQQRAVDKKILSMLEAMRRDTEATKYDDLIDFLEVELAYGVPDEGVWSAKFDQILDQARQIAITSG